MSLKVSDIIAKKRDGGCLSEEEIGYFVAGLTAGYVQDVQIGAWLMAVFLKGMTDDETSYLTRAMLQSGKTFHWRESIQGLLVDKHSTGGVGDKISLVLVPALAVCGLKVPMISGRGLGFTGGTIDKLESIPGFQALMSLEKATEMIETVGCFIMAQTDDIVPADKIFYASRDVTETVASLPLITASIMSKKAAERPSVLLIDLKCGRAAFVRDRKTAKTLANLMVKVGCELGIKTAVAITKMDCPIGKKIGNALEVEESVNVLKGNGPSDVEELVCIEGGLLLHLSGRVHNIVEGKSRIREVLHNGEALKKFQEMICAQGVSWITSEDVCRGDPVQTGLPRALHVTDLAYNGPTGTIGSIDALELALVSGELGAQRTKIGEPVNFGVGLELLKKPGESIVKGQTWIRVHHDSTTGILRGEHIEKLQTALFVAEFEGSHREDDTSPIIEIIY